MAIFRCMTASNGCRTSGSTAVTDSSLGTIRAGRNSLIRSIALRRRFLTRPVAVSLIYLAASAAQAAGPTAFQHSAPAQDAQGQSAQAFVQGFYDWYIGKGGWNTAMALRNKRWPLGTELASALKAELEAPEDSSGDGDNLAFGPL